MLKGVKVHHKKRTERFPTKPFAMNTKRIELALTVQLIENNLKKQLIAGLKDLFNSLRDEVGNLIHEENTPNKILDRHYSLRTHHIHFDNCKVSFDLIKDEFTGEEQVNRFHIQ